MKELSKATMYWKCNYRGNAGWKIKYYFGIESDVLAYANKRLTFDKMELENLSMVEVGILEKDYKKKFQVITA